MQGNSALLVSGASNTKNLFYPIVRLAFFCLVLLQNLFEDLQKNMVKLKAKDQILGIEGSCNLKMLSKFVQ